MLKCFSYFPENECTNENFNTSTHPFCSKNWISENIKLISAYLTVQTYCRFNLKLIFLPLPYFPFLFLLVNTKYIKLVKTYFNEHNVCCLHSNIRSRANCDAYISLCQGWRIIDTISYHGHHHPRCLQLFDLLHLVRWQDLCINLADPNLRWTQYSCITRTAFGWYHRSKTWWFKELVRIQTKPLIRHASDKNRNTILMCLSYVTADFVVLIPTY